VAVTGGGSPRALYLLHSHYASDPRPRRQAEALRDAGWNVTVFCLGGRGETAPFTVDGVRVVPFAMSRYRGEKAGSYLWVYIRFLLWAAAKVMRQCRRYDLVHIHTPPDFLAFAALPARWGGARLLLDIHDVTPELFRERFGDRHPFLVRVAKLLERWSAGIVHQVITVNEPLRRILDARGTSREKVSVIMNLPAEKIFWRERPLPPPEKPVLAYHGTLVPHYGPQILLEAAALLVPSYPDLVVRIIGDGDLKPALLARANRPDLAGRVHFSPDRVLVNRIPDALGQVTVGVVANRATGYTRLVLPTKLLEYLAMGIPAVVTRTETIDHYFEPDEVVTVREPDPAELARVLRRMIENPEESAAQVERARKFLRRHNWRAEGGRYVQLAERLVGRVRGSGGASGPPGRPPRGRGVSRSPQSDRG
jgi:glycosyltransferase involved in cell wall biosynthesis